MARRLNFGKEMAKKTKGKTNTEIYGKDKAKIIGKKISKKLSERQKGKTWEELWGKETADRVKEKLSKRSSLQKNMLGKKHSIETKKKMSNSRLGDKHYFFGKTHTKRTKEILSKKCGHKMEANPAWKGGKSFENYGKEFNSKLKNNIKIRDGHMCQVCEDYIPINESSRIRLVVHHIDEDKKNNDKNNLITLCNFCHTSVHMSKQEWAIFLKNRLVGELSG